MVKQVERWQAEDGTLFDTLEDCEYHEAYKDRLQVIEDELGKYPTAAEIYNFIATRTQGWK